MWWWFWEQIFLKELRFRTQKTRWSLGDWGGGGGSLVVLSVHRSHKLLWLFFSTCSNIKLVFLPVTDYFATGGTCVIICSSYAETVKLYSTCKVLSCQNLVLSLFFFFFFSRTLVWWWGRIQETVVTLASHFVWKKGHGEIYFTQSLDRFCRDVPASSSCQ